MNDFLKYAYKSGKVRSVAEAFDEFNPEEEIHQGKIDVLLKEEDENYETYAVGDIVFVNQYDYENGKRGKNHFFVIVEQNNLAVSIENFGMLISSKMEKLKYKTNKLLEANDKNGLAMDSIVKTDVIYLIKNKQILFKIGSVDRDKVDVYRECFLEKNKN